MDFCFKRLGVFAGILGHSTNCKKLPLNFFLGGLVGQQCSSHFFARSFLEGTEKCTLNHCWSFPLGFLPRKTSANLRLAWEKSYASLKCLTIGRAHQSLWCQPITGSSTLLCREPAACLHSQKEKNMCEYVCTHNCPQRYYTQNHRKSMKIK